MLIRRDEHNIDRVFRQKLHDAQETPPAHLWEGIRANTKSRKRFFGYWFALCAAVMLTIGFGSYALISTNQVLANKELPGQTARAAQQQPNAPEQAAHTAIKKEKVLATENNTASNNAIAEKKETIRLKNEPAVLNKKATNKKIKSTSPAAINTKQTKTPTENNSTAQSTSDNAIPHAEIHTEVKGFSQDFSITENQTMSTPTTISDAELSVSNSNATSPSDSIATNTTAPDSANIPALYTSPVINKPNHFSIGLYGTYFQPQRHFTQQPSTSQSYGYVQPSQIKMHTGYATGIALTYQIQKHIYGVGAIEYMSFKEDMKYSQAQEHANYSYYNLTDSVQVIENGDTTTVAVTIPVVYDTTYTYQGHNTKQINTYSTFQIPLLLGANQTINKWTFGVEAGPVVHITKWYNGDLRSNDIIVASADTSAQSMGATSQRIAGSQISTSNYYKNWNLDLHTGVRIGYNLSSNWQVALGGQYRFMMRRTQDQVLSRHRMALPGVSFGLYYQF
jgi:hypothetical protein